MSLTVTRAHTAHQLLAFMTTSGGTLSLSMLDATHVNALPPVADTYTPHA
jgi:hypothetical protein